MTLSMKIVKKISVLVVFTILFALIINKAVAGANINTKNILSEKNQILRGYQPISFTTPVVNCEDFHSSMQELEKSLVTVNTSISDFAKQASFVYADWYVEFNARENKSTSYKTGDFSAINTTVKLLSAASDNMFKYEDQASEIIQAWGGEIQACANWNSDWDDELELATDRVREHFSSNANFFAQMSSQLGRWVKLWINLEGNTHSVPNGYFSSLGEASEKYQEASELFLENVALSLAPLDVISHQNIVP
jgi:hypothetical protein